jgi:hypothetical protein
VGIREGRPATRLVDDNLGTERECTAVKVNQLSLRKSRLYHSVS